MTKKYEFTLATNRLGSEVADIVEIAFDDNATEEEIEKIVCEEYAEWVAEHNHGSFQEITD